MNVTLKISKKYVSLIEAAKVITTALSTQCVTFTRFVIPYFLYFTVQLNFEQISC
jgi:hypothetical protein